MSVSQEEVFWAFRLILGREPEYDEIIHLQHPMPQDLRSLCVTLLTLVGSSREGYLSELIRPGRQAGDTASGAPAITIASRGLMSAIEQAFAEKLGVVLDHLTSLNGVWYTRMARRADQLKLRTFVSREEVLWSYRLFLGREPRSEAEVRKHQFHVTRRSLAESMIRSTEFASSGPLSDVLRASVTQSLTPPCCRSISRNPASESEARSSQAVASIGSAGQREEGPTQEEVDSLRWWHSFTFPNGVKALGAKTDEFLRAEAGAVFKYPVEGKTVLDVGAWNGYFSIEAAQRGARKVVALDQPTWDTASQGFEGFELAKRYLAPQIEAVKRDVMDLRQTDLGKFDWVLFLGVLYHLKHPLYVLETLYEVTGELLVVETHVDLTDYDRPAMVFYPGSEQAGDPTNWWGPNVQCVLDMLRTVGFARVECADHPFEGQHVRRFFYAFK